MHFNNVIGVPQFSIPGLGYVSDFIQNPPGMYITIGVGVVMILLVFLPEYLANITVTTFGENRIDTILDNFYTVD